MLSGDTCVCAHVGEQPCASIDTGSYSLCDTGTRPNHKSHGCFIYAGAFNSRHDRISPRHSPHSPCVPARMRNQDATSASLLLLDAHHELYSHTLLAAGRLVGRGACGRAAAGGNGECNVWRWRGEYGADLPSRERVRAAHRVCQRAVPDRQAYAQHQHERAAQRGLGVR